MAEIKWVAIKAKEVVAEGAEKEEVIRTLKDLFARQNKCSLSGKKLAIALKEFIRQFRICKVKA